MSKLYTILLNGKAGAARTGSKPSKLEEAIAELNLDAEIVHTRSIAHLHKELKRLIKDGDRTIIIAGGDGTIAQAVQTLAYSGAVFGIVPMGTFNNFAHALGIPADPKEALAAIDTGKVREVSLGKIGETFFTEGAGIGLLADALAVGSVGVTKNIFMGMLAVLKVLINFKARRVKLTIDGQPYLDRATLCTVANSYRLGAGFPLAPEAKLSDNVLDIVIIGDLTYAELIPYYRAMRSHKHLELPKVTKITAKEVRIESLWDAPVHCDDRIVGTTPVTISVAPGALKILAG